MVWPLAALGSGNEAWNTWGVGQRLLDLAVHVLSASNVGATLVWCRRASGDPSPALDFAKAEGVQKLSLHDDLAFPLVRNIAAQNDRAIVVDAVGQVTAIGVTLVAPVEVTVTTDGGMRHNSAVKASTVDDQSVFIVASADGPVSVFFGGRKVASFTRAEWMTSCRGCGGHGWAEVAPADGTSELELQEGPWMVQCERCQGQGEHWSSGPIIRGASRRRPIRGRSGPQRALPRLFPIAGS
jgi:hypothetical protein